MRVFFKILKWIIAIPMGVLLVLALLVLFSVKFATSLVPMGVNDTSWLPLTVKQVSLARNGIAFTANEYATVFALTLVPPPTNITDMVRPGDKIALRVKTEVAQHVDGHKMAGAFGLQLSDGRQVFDTTATIARLSPSSFGRVDFYLYNMLIIPSLYFLAIIFVPLIRRTSRRDNWVT